MMTDGKRKTGTKNEIEISENYMFIRRESRAGLPGNRKNRRIKLCKTEKNRGFEKEFPQKIFCANKRYDREKKGGILNKK